MKIITIKNVEVFEIIKARETTVRLQTIPEKQLNQVENMKKLMLTM
jgi:hypothetical protein